MPLVINTFEQGFVAYRLGKTLNHNPYNPGTIYSGEWVRGFEAAQVFPLETAQRAYDNILAQRVPSLPRDTGWFGRVTGD